MSCASLAVLTALTVLLVVSGEILALRTPYPSVQRYARALLDGPWSKLFWAELVLFFLAAIVSLVIMAGKQLRHLVRDHSVTRLRCRVH